MDEPEAWDRDTCITTPDDWKVTDYAGGRMYWDEADSARAPTPHSLHLRAHSHPVTIPNRGGDGRARAATSWSGEEMGQRRQESGGEGPGTRTGREGQTGNQGDSGGARRTARAGHTQAAGQGHRGRTGSSRHRQETADRQGTSSNKVTG